MKEFGKKNLDVLQNIEFGIVDVYRADRSLLDVDAKDAIDALVRYYHAEEEQRQAPVLRLSDRAQQVFSSVQNICEWRLGRAALPGEIGMAAGTIPAPELVACLREIQKSIPRWSRLRGRQGYLEFVSQFVQ